MSEKSIKVAIDILSDVPGLSGQVNIFRNLLSILPKLRPNWEYYIFSTKNLTEYYQNIIGENQENVNWINCWYDNSNGSVKRILTQEVQVPYLINKFKIDAFLCYPLPFITPMQKTKTIYRQTCTVNIVNSIKSKRMKYRIRKILYSIKNSNSTIFNSNFERQNVTNLGLKYKNSKVIWESFDKEIFSQSNSNKLNISTKIQDIVQSKKKIILIPTGLQPSKNSELVFKFLESSYKALFDDYIFIFMGSNDENHATHLKSKYENLLKNGFINILGFCTHEEVAFIGRNCFLVIYPSLIESFGIPPLEMMSLRKPVIISDIPPLIEISGGGALSFKHNSEEDLAQKVFLLLNSTEERERLANKGYEYVNKFSWEKNVRETAFLIEEVLNNY